MLQFNLEEERQALVENLRAALKESGLSFQEWEMREQELMRAAVTREQRSHLLETFFRHLFYQVCMGDQICSCASVCGGALTCIRPGVTPGQVRDHSQESTLL